jgi:hypothetical protein
MHSNGLFFTACAFLQLQFLLGLYSSIVRLSLVSELQRCTYDCEFSCCKILFTSLWCPEGMVNINKPKTLDILKSSWPAVKLRSAAI